MSILNGSSRDSYDIQCRCVPPVYLQKSTSKSTCPGAKGIQGVSCLLLSKRPCGQLQSPGAAPSAWLKTETQRTGSLAIGFSCLYFLCIVFLKKTLTSLTIHEYLQGIVYLVIFSSRSSPQGYFRYSQKSGSSNDGEWKSPGKSFHRTVTRCDQQTLCHKYLRTVIIQPI